MRTFTATSYVKVRIHSCPSAAIRNKNVNNLQKNIS